MAKGKTQKSTPNNNKTPVYKEWWFWLIIIAVICIAGVAASNNKEKEPKKVGETTIPSATESSNEPTSTQTEFKVGDIISVKDAEVTVISVERNYSTGSPYFKPKDGKEYVKVNLQIVNKSNDKISYNTLDWKIEDSNGVIEDYLSAAMAAADDSLDSGDLAVGGKKVGSIVFEVPAGDAKLKLHYKPVLSFNDEITINL